MLDLASRVQYVKGIGPRKAELLAAAGIHTVGDLLLYLPFRYEDQSRIKPIRDLKPGEEASIAVEVLRVHLRRAQRRRNFTLLELEVGDGSGSLTAVWFNQSFLKEKFPVGSHLLLYGRFDPGFARARLQISNPQYELVEKGELATIHAGRIVPIYERIGPLSPRLLRSIFHFLLQNLPREVPELLPPSVRERKTLPWRREALVQVHSPEDASLVDLFNAFRAPAQLRLIFEELFLFFLGIELRRRALGESLKPRAFPVDDRIRDIVRKLLPFPLTGAQREVLKTIAQELGSPRPMRRLLQGDVGSGKTIVAVLASVVVIENRAQVAFMVPTEILAEQHFERFQKLLARTGYRMALLRSGLKRAEREEVLDAIARGELDLVVGTHALIQGQVRFKELGLVIIDEQHRFGVRQRAELWRKGETGSQPDLLVMTATPIPRSQAMALYGDMDHLELSELPPGRQPVATLIKPSEAREEVYRLMEQEVAAGHQVYFVCPLVEESEKSDLKAAAEVVKSLSQGPFAHRRVALAHGRMKSAEVETTMSAFARGEIDVLVATTVIEVGVDVSNATLIVIEHAERFGLAQLHQLRGRVGRGKAASTAVLLYHRPLSEVAQARLKVLAESQNGFFIAERDLDLRGPGDFFGTRQSGDPLFRVANVVRDRSLFQEARREAREYLLSPDSRGPEGERLLRQVEQAFRPHFGLAAVG